VSGNGTGNGTGNRTGAVSGNGTGNRTGAVSGNGTGNRTGAVSGNGIDAGFDPGAEPTLWHQRSRGPTRPPLDGANTADAVIVGAGMTGLAVALELAEQGLSVIVLDAGFVGCGATGRNVGFVLQGVAESYARTVALWGRDKARRARTMTRHNHELVLGRIQRHDIRCDYRRAGTLHLAGSDEEAAELAQSAQCLLDDGFDADLLGEGAIPAWARGRYRAGLLIPPDGELDPVAFAVGLAAAAEAAGVRIFEGSDALALVDGADGVLVRTTGGTAQAEVAVVAANAWAQRILPWAEQRIEPTRGQVLATAPVKTRLFDQPIYASHGFEYWRQLPSGEIVLGGWRHLDVPGEVGMDHRVHGGIQDAMTAFVRGLHPALADVPITTRWSGIMGFSRDSLPLVGPVPGQQRVHVAAGFTGHGFGFALAAAEALGQIISAGRSDWDDLLSPRRLVSS
jgi:gamma-glutamylputrescine oxidase